MALSWSNNADYWSWPVKQSCNLNNFGLDGWLLKKKKKKMLCLNFFWPPNFCWCTLHFWVYEKNLPHFVLINWIIKTAVVKTVQFIGKQLITEWLGIINMLYCYCCLYYSICKKKKFYVSFMLYIDHFISHFLLYAILASKTSTFSKYIFFRFHGDISQCYFTQGFVFSKIFSISYTLPYMHR